jgi:hypothetical protein
MEFKIIRGFSDHLLLANQLKWRLLIRKQYPLFALNLALALILLFLGMTQASGIWNIFTTGGLLFFVFALRFVYHTMLSKGKFLDSLKKNLLNNDGRTTEISISDAGVTYQDQDAHSDLKWSFFSSFKVHENYLFLISGESLMGAISLGENELPTGDFEKLCVLVSSKLPAWK